MGYVDPWSVGTFLRLLFSPAKKETTSNPFCVGLVFLGFEGNGFSANPQPATCQAHQIIKG